ncbi:MAG: PEP-CTERM sorting domain-containing protein [Planctomycetota bacterium]
MALLTACGLGAQGQLFTDDIGDPTKWTVEGDGSLAGSGDVRFGFDYGSYDLFNETEYLNVTPAAAGFITGSIPEAPNSSGGAATTGIFMSANNSSLVPTSLFSGIYANGVNVGQGTANTDYVLRFDAFHSVATGLDGGIPPSATNYAWASINTTGPGAYAGPFGTGSAGQTIAITGEQGAGDDFETTIGERTFETRGEGNTGLATDTIYNAWINSGFTFENPDPNPDGLVLTLSNRTEDSLFASPLPNSPETFERTTAETIENTTNQYWLDKFPKTTDPLHYDTASNENANDILPGGTPYNRWAEHEIYYIDDVWTYVIDGALVTQLDLSQPLVAVPDDPETAEDETVLVDPTNAGTFALGFLDGFSSFNADPEGSNFVVYDNIVLSDGAGETAPDLETALAGYLPLATGGGIVGDYDGSGLVEQGDLNLVLTNWGTDRAFSDPGGTDFSTLLVDQEELNTVLSNWGSSSAPSFEGFEVPEPGALALLGGLALAGLRRRSA